MFWGCGKFEPPPTPLAGVELREKHVGGLGWDCGAILQLGELNDGLHGIFGKWSKPRTASTMYIECSHCGKDITKTYQSTNESVFVLTTFIAVLCCFLRGSGCKSCLILSTALRKACFETFEF